MLDVRTSKGREARLKEVVERCRQEWENSYNQVATEDHEVQSMRIGREGLMTEEGLRWIDQELQHGVEMNR